MSYENRADLKLRMKLLKVNSVLLARALGEKSPALVRQKLGGFMLLRPEVERKITKYLDGIESHVKINNSQNGGRNVRNRLNS